MTYTQTEQGDETVLCIQGALDAVTAPDIRSTLDRLVLNQQKTIIVDLSALRLIDSSGVGAIVSLFKRVRAYGGEVRVVGLKNQPLAIFQLLRLDRVFSLDPGVTQQSQGGTRL
jgi:anti-sigma B factor antagonist